jgi:hypothetical protein
MADHTPRALLDTLRAELEPLARLPRFLELLRAAKVPRERLEWLAGEQRHIISSDQRSFSLLAARFPEAPAGEFFLDLARGEMQALRLLDDYVSALGVDLTSYWPKPLAQSYPHFLGWCAVNAGRSAVALAMAANLRIWGSYCAETADALESRYDLSGRDVAFFHFFASPPPDFDERALDVIASGLAAGESPEAGLHAGRTMHAYELAFWNTLVEGLE